MKGTPPTVLCCCILGLTIKYSQLSIKFPNILGVAKWKNCPNTTNVFVEAMLIGHHCQYIDLYIVL